MSNLKLCWKLLTFNSFFLRLIHRYTTPSLTNGRQNMVYPNHAVVVAPPLYWWGTKFMFHMATEVDTNRGIIPLHWGGWTIIVYPRIVGTPIFPTHPIQGITPVVVW